MPPNQNYSDFNVAIHRILKRVYPDMSIASATVDILNDYINDTFHQIAKEAGRLAEANKKSEVTANDIQAAVHLILPGKLATYAAREAVASMCKFNEGDEAQNFNDPEEE